MDIEICTKDDGISWEDLTNLAHESFLERLKMGLHFGASTITPEQYKVYGSGRLILVAVDRSNGTLAGTMSFKLNKDNNTYWGEHGGLAVRPGYKKRGIATKLFERLLEVAKEKKCEFILSDTAVGAESSVRWHKKNGFKIVGLDSFSSTNYYSYIFRKQLLYHPMWSNSFYCWIRFLFSALRCKVRFTTDGKTTKLMDLYLRIRGAK